MRGSAVPVCGKVRSAATCSRTLSSSARPGIVASPAGLATATSRSDCQRISSEGVDFTVGKGVVTRRKMCGDELSPIIRKLLGVGAHELGDPRLIGIDLQALPPGIDRRPALGFFKAQALVVLRNEHPAALVH